MHCQPCLPFYSKQPSLHAASGGCTAAVSLQPLLLGFQECHGNTQSTSMHSSHIGHACQARHGQHEQRGSHPALPSMERVQITRLLVCSLCLTPAESCREATHTHTHTHTHKLYADQWLIDNSVTLVESGRTNRQEVTTDVWTSAVMWTAIPQLVE